MDAGELGARHLSVTWLVLPARAEQELRSHEEAMTLPKARFFELRTPRAHHPASVVGVPELSRTQVAVYGAIAVALLFVGARAVRGEGGGESSGYTSSYEYGSEDEAETED